MWPHFTPHSNYTHNKRKHVCCQMEETRQISTYPPCSFLVYSLEKFGVTDGVVSGTLEDAHQHPQVFSGREPEHPYTHSQLLPALLPPNGDFSFLN